jgi:hypothetical protein
VEIEMFRMEMLTAHSSGVTVLEWQWSETAKTAVTPVGLYVRFYTSSDYDTDRFRFGGCNRDDQVAFQCLKFSTVLKDEGKGKIAPVCNHRGIREHK